MRQLLLTSAIITPLLAGAAFAQDTTEPAEEPAVQQDQATEGAAGEATEDPVIVEETEVEPEADTAEGAADPAAETTEEAVEVETAPAATAEGTEAEEPAADMAEEGDAATEEVEVETAEGTEPPAETILREQAANELRVDWITGSTITSPDGETIGEVQDLIVDGETGQVAAAIVGVGGFLGIGAKQIAVDFAEMQIDYDAQEITMDLTREEADAAPEYAFREQESAPAPEPAMDTGTGMAPAPAPAPAN